MIFLSLKLKWGLNALLPAHVDLGALAFEHLIRNFLRFKIHVNFGGAVLLTHLAWLVYASAGRFWVSAFCSECFLVYSSWSFVAILPSSTMNAPW